MSLILDIAVGVCKAIGCFSLLLGAVLIIDYADLKSRSNRHKRYHSVMLLIAAIACYYPAREMTDGIFLTMSVPEKAAFIIAGILCAFTLFLIISNLARREE